VDKGQQDWELAGFLDRFDLWVDQDSPAEGIRLGVLRWILGLYDDPYRGAKRVPDFPDPNFWEARIPASRDGAGNIVVCSYWIYEATRTVACDLFGTFWEETLE
jgi:hypothetical protein